MTCAPKLTSLLASWNAGCMWPCAGYSMRRKRWRNMVMLDLDCVVCTCSCLLMESQLDIYHAMCNLSWLILLSCELLKICYECDV